MEEMEKILDEINEKLVPLPAVIQKLEKYVDVISEEITDRKKDTNV